MIGLKSVPHDIAELKYSENSEMSLLQICALNLREKKIYETE